MGIGELSVIADKEEAFSKKKFPIHKQTFFFPFPREEKKTNQNKKISLSVYDSMPKVAIKGRGKDFQDYNANSFQNQKEVKKYCLSITPHIEFVDSRCKQCQWIISPHVNKDSTPLVNSPKQMSFSEFENYLYKHQYCLRDCDAPS